MLKLDPTWSRRLRDLAAAAAVASSVGGGTASAERTAWGAHESFAHPEQKRLGPSSGPAPGLASPASVAGASAPTAPPGLTAIPPGEYAPTAPLDARGMRRLGGLERAAAALTPAMEAYLAALRELVPALHVATAEGGRPGAQPDSAVPEAARQALAAAAGHLAGWQRPGEVPLLAWAAHEEVVDAAREVAAAGRLRGLLAPSQALLQAFERQQDLVAALLDLLGSKRAVGVFNVDDDNLAAEVRRSREAVRRALAALSGPAKGGDDARLAALSADLQEALDAAAFAQASASSTADRLGSSYLPLAEVHHAVGTRLAEFERALASLGAAPPPAAAQLTAELRQHNEEMLEVELRWLAPTRPHDGASVLQVVRRLDVAAAREAVAAQASCGALSAEEAQAALAEVAANEAPQTIGVLSGDAFAFRESRPRRTIDWPASYRVVATSAFGVEAHAHEERARPAFVALQPAKRPHARLLTPRYDDPNFYRLGDAVEVRWARSLSDPSETEAVGDPEVAAVKSYAVYRLDAAASALHGAVEPALAPLVTAKGSGPGDVLLGDALPTGWHWAGSAPAGSDRLVDRPSLAELAAGTSYVVVAVGEDGSEARVPGRCGQSETVQQNLAETWALAASGAARAKVPSAEERRLASELAAPEALAAATAAFAARPLAEQQAAWQQYWSRLPEPERAALRARGPELFGEGQLAQAKAQGYLNLCERLRQWARLGCYVQDQPGLRRAAAQHWQLLTPAERHVADRNLLHTLGPALAAATAKAVGLDEGGPESQLWAFWQARDDRERQALAQWWEAAGPEGQTARLRAFWAGLNEDQQLAATWPQLSLLTPEERRAALDEAPWPVPQHLLAPLFAFLTHDALPAAQKRRAIAAEVGPVWRAVEALHYALRPLDLWTNFKLPLLVSLLGVGLVAGWLVQQLSGRDRD